jgi:ribosome-interacting GTPase 1
VARTCDLILIILDATRPVAHKKILENELEGFGIRLNKKAPGIIIRKKEKGGVGIIRQCKMTKLDDETIMAIAKEYKLLNADFTFSTDSDADDLIDSIEGNRRYVPCLYVLNKIDDITLEELEILDRIPHYVPICGLLEWGIDDLLDTMWDYLDLIRIYTKPKVNLIFLKENRVKFLIMMLL